MYLARGVVKKHTNIPRRRQIHAGMMLAKDGPYWRIVAHPTTDLSMGRVRQDGVEAMMKNLVNSEVDFIMITAYITEQRESDA